MAFLFLHFAIQKLHLNPLKAPNNYNLIKKSQYLW